MFQQHLKIAVRNFRKHGSHSAINLVGLSVGLALTILIALWINWQWNINRFHEHGDRIFQVLTNYTFNGEVETGRSTPAPLAAKLLDGFPEIQQVCRTSAEWPHLVLHGEDAYFELGRYVDSSFLEVFTFPLLHGSKENALSSPDNVLITKSLAEKIFGRSDAIGEVLRFENNLQKVVSGVLDDPPSGSQMQFRMLFPMSVFLKNHEGLLGWNSNNLLTFVLAAPGHSAGPLSERVRDLVKANSTVGHTELMAYPLTDLYLRWDFENGKYAGGGFIENLWLFGIVAAMILLLACINYMNLATAKSFTRGGEVGVRKVVGASRLSLVSQFFTESAVTIFVAGLLGLSLASMLLPMFNQIFGLEISLNQAALSFWAVAGCLILLAAFVAGSYPAMLLSGFTPVKVLKGQFKSGAAATQIRKGLVVFQFAISTVIIICAFVVAQQIDFIKNKNLGYKKDSLLCVRGNDHLAATFSALKTDLVQMPEVVQVSMAQGLVHRWGDATSKVDWPGKTDGQKTTFKVISAGYGFLETIGADLSSGRDFSADFPADTMNFLVNETAAKVLGFDDPLGQPLKVWDIEGGSIVGVVKDFHVGSMHHAQDPAILLLRPESGFVYLRLNPQPDLSSTLAALKTIFKKHSPDYPFEYSFTDDSYEAMHDSEFRIGKLSKVFGLLAILISCLGLFGLVAFTVEQRTKEIGIRKVLGATTAGLVGLLSKDFLKLVVIALVIASPLAYFFMEKWLQDFAYRIEIQWWVFAVAGIAAVGVAFLTVSFQSVKAALANPVKSLRSE